MRRGLPQARGQWEGTMEYIALEPVLIRRPLSLVDVFTKRLLETGTKSSKNLL
jgi:hypothetical protein